MLSSHAQEPKEQGIKSPKAPSVVSGRDRSRQWDALEAPSADSAMATTSRLDASARTELFDSSSWDSSPKEAKQSHLTRSHKGVVFSP